MQFDKSQIVDLLRLEGDSAKAHQAEEQLPEQVDSEQHAGLLEKIGLSPQELIGKLAGGGLGGGLGGLLGR
jgi:hypothetical protein